MIDVNNILSETRKIGEKAAQEQYNKLTEAGPKYTVHNADIFNQTLGPAVGTLLDNCGNAWIELSGKSSFIREIKKQYKDSSGIGGCNATYQGNGWYLRKGVYKGYSLHISYSLRSRQEMSVHEAANYAMVDYLKSNNIDCHVHSYID